MLFISFITIFSLSLSFAREVPICYWYKFKAPAIWDMTNVSWDNLEVFLLNPLSTLFVPFGAVSCASPDLQSHRLSNWRFMSHGNVCLVFWDSHKCVGAWPMHRCDIWSTGCPGVPEVTWVSRSWWSHMVVNIRCLIFDIRCARFRITEPKAGFYFQNLEWVESF